MDYDLTDKLKRGNMKAFRELYGKELRRLWYLCFAITQNAGKAATLLLTGWKQAMEEIVCSAEFPKNSFRAIFSKNAFKIALGEPESSEEHETLAEPELPKEYDVFTEAIRQLEYEERCIYLFSALGGLSDREISTILKKPVPESRKRLADATERVQNSDRIKKLGVQKAVSLSTQFRRSDGKLFDGIGMEQSIINALEHDYQVLMRTGGKGKMKSNVRKDNKNMNTSTKPGGKGTAKKAGFRYTKPIVIAVVLVIALIAGIIFLPKLLNKNTASTRITTYHVDEITYGNVSTTITGSGTLTPITKETLTSTYSGEVKTVNYSVGAEVAEDAVIAVITGDSGDEEIVAPCAGILIDQPVAVGSSVNKGETVAMVMGKDGFTLGIAVDEQNIASVALKQEVSFTLDAVSGDFTGSVTNISYNGSTSGGSTSYQITATLAYTEGMYPGMSASAKIVVEDSGEGLLVPVDAAKTSGDDSYITLAPSGSELGTVYAEEEIDADNLTQVTVETGMSDGSYIMITSDGIAKGDLIVVTKVTSTATGSDSDSSSDRGGFSGGGKGKDFSNFDPSQMPNGGGGFSGQGSN